MSREEFPLKVPALQHAVNKGQIVLKIKLPDGRECYLHGNIKKQDVLKKIPVKNSSSYSSSPDVNSCKNDDSMCTKNLASQHSPHQVYLPQEMGSGQVDACRTEGTQDEKAKNSSQTRTKCGHEHVAQTKLSHQSGVQSCKFENSHYDSSTTLTCSPITQNAEPVCCLHPTSKDLSLETTTGCGVSEVLSMENSREDWPAVSSSHDSIASTKLTWLGNKSAFKNNSHRHSCYDNESGDAEDETDQSKRFSVGQNKQSGTIASASVTINCPSLVPSTTELDPQDGICPESETKGGSSSSSQLTLNRNIRLCSTFVLGSPQSGSGASGDVRRSCPEPKHVFIKSEQKETSVHKAAAEHAHKDTLSGAEESKTQSCKEDYSSASDTQGSICAEDRATDMAEDATSSFHTLSLNKKCGSLVSGLPHADCEKYKNAIRLYPEQPFIFIKSDVRKGNRTDIADPESTRMLSSPQDTNHETLLNPKMFTVSSTPAVKNAQEFKSSVEMVQGYESVEGKTTFYQDGMDAVENNICEKRVQKRFDGFNLVVQTDDASVNNSEEMVRYTVVPKHPVLQEKIKQTQEEGKLEPESRSEALCKCDSQFTQGCNSSKVCVKCGKLRLRFQSETQRRSQIQLAETHVQIMNRIFVEHAYCIPHTEARKQSWEFYKITQTEDTCANSVETSWFNGQVHHVSSSAETGERKTVGEVAAEGHLNISSISKVESSTVFAEELSKVSENMVVRKSEINPSTFNVFTFEGTSPSHYHFSVAAQSPVFPMKCCYVVIDRLEQMPSGCFRPSTSCNRYCREECLEFLCGYGSLDKCKYSAQFRKPEEMDECTSSDERLCRKQKTEQKDECTSSNQRLCRKRNAEQSDECASSNQRLCRKQKSAEESPYSGGFLPLNSLCGEGKTEVRITSSSIEVGADSCSPVYNRLEETRSNNTHKNCEGLPSKEQKATASKSISKSRKSYKKHKKTHKDTQLSCSYNVFKATDLKKRHKRTSGKMLKICKFNIRYYVFKAMGRAFFVPLLKGRPKLKLDAEDLLFVKKVIVQMLEDKHTCARCLEYPECMKHKAGKCDRSTWESRNTSSLFLPSIANLDVESLEALIRDGKFSKLIPRTPGQTQVQYLEQIGQYLHSYLIGSESNAGDWIKAVVKDIMEKQKRGKGARRLKSSKDIAIEIDIADDADEIDVGEENIWSDAVQEHFSLERTGVHLNETISSGLAGDSFSGSESFDVSPHIQHEGSQESSSALHTGSYVCEEAYIQETKPLLAEIIGASVLTGGYQENEKLVIPRQTNGPLLPSVCEQTQYSASELLRTRGQVVVTPVCQGLFSAKNMGLNSHAVSGNDSGVFNKSDFSAVSEPSNHPETKSIIGELLPSTSVQLSPIAFTGHQKEQMEHHQQMDVQSQESQSAGLSYAVVKQEPPCENFCHAWPSIPQENCYTESVETCTPDATLPCITSVTFGEEAAYIASSAELGESEDVSSSQLPSDSVFIAKTSVVGEEFSKSELGISMEFLNHFSGSTKRLQDRAESASSSRQVGRLVVSADDKFMVKDGHGMTTGESTPVIGEQPSILSGWLPNGVSLDDAEYLPTNTVLEKEHLDKKTSPANNPDIRAVQFYSHNGAVSFDSEKAEKGRDGEVRGVLEHCSSALAFDPCEDLNSSRVNGGNELKRTVAKESQYSEVLGNAEDCVDQGSVRSSPDENSFHHDSCGDFFEDESEESEESDGELKGAIQSVIYSVLCDSDSTFGAQNEAQVSTNKNEEEHMTDKRLVDMQCLTNWVSAGNEAAKSGSFSITSSANDFFEDADSSDSESVGGETEAKPFSLLPSKTVPDCKRGTKRKARSSSGKCGKRLPAKKTASHSSASALVSGIVPRTLKAETCLDFVVVPEVCTDTEDSSSSLPCSAAAADPLLSRLTCTGGSSPAADNSKQNSQADTKCHTTYVDTQKITNIRPVSESETSVHQGKGLSIDKQERSPKNNVGRDLAEVPVVEIDKALEKDVADGLLTEVLDGPNTEPCINMPQQVAKRSSAPNCKSKWKTSKRCKGDKRKCWKTEKVSRVSSGVAFCLEPLGAAQLSEEPKPAETCSVSPFTMVSDKALPGTCRDQSLKTDVTIHHAEEAGVCAVADSGLMGTLPQLSNMITPSADVRDAKIPLSMPVRDRERSFFDWLPEHFLEAWKT